MKASIQLIDIERERIKELLSKASQSLSKDHLSAQLFALNQLRDKMVYLQNSIEKATKEQIQYL